jgi:hypothetical protein
LKVQIVGSNKVLGVHFQCAPIDFNKEMEDIEEINETRTQLENLKAIGYLTHNVTNVEILEFGLTLSSKSYIVTKEAHSSETITRSIKSTKEGQNMESEFGLN